MHVPPTGPRASWVGKVLFFFTGFLIAVGSPFTAVFLMIDDLPDILDNEDDTD